jgi:ferredoxin, 2Fe-2S
VDVSTKSLTVLKFNHSEIEFVREIDLPTEGNLLEILNAHKISISQSCGGFATCTTCRILVTKGQSQLGPRTEIELERAQERGFKPNERLACQAEVISDETSNLEIIIANPN